MRTTTVLRAARPRPASPMRGTDARAERELAALLGEEYAPPSSSRRAFRIRPAVLVNAGVAALVVAASVLTVMLVGPVRERPADVPSIPSEHRLFVTPHDFVDLTRGPLTVWGSEPQTLAFAANGCVTLGSAFLQAPEGSSLHGDIVDLAGIGRVRIGDRLWSGRGTEVYWPGADTEYVRGSFGCGEGTYLVLGEASMSPPASPANTPEVSASSTPARGLPQR